MGRAQPSIERAAFVSLRLRAWPRGRILVRGLLLIPCLSSVFRRRGEAIRPSPDPEEPMKRFFALLPLVLAASLVSAQETNPSRDPKTKGNEGTFGGEVVATDTTAKTLTVKTSVPDAKGDRSE